MTDTEKKIAEVLDLSKPVSDCPECGGLGEIRSLGSRRKCECLYSRLKTLKRELDRKDEENRMFRERLKEEIVWQDECLKLEEQLQSAHQEIERLREENEGRKKIIEAYMRIEHDLAEDAERLQSEVSRLRLRDSLLKQLHAQIADYFGGEGGLAKLQDGVHALKAEIDRLQEERSKLIECLRFYERLARGREVNDGGRRARTILAEIGVTVE